MDDLDRNSPIYEKQIGIRFQVGEAEQKLSYFTVRVLAGSRSSTVKQKIVMIEVTDEAEAFYHSLTISESDFADLKTDQAILVDFDAFPAMFFELIDKCIGADGPNSSRFSCILNVRDPNPGTPSVLSIVETNHFKQITHLQLHLRAGSDSVVKRYLSARLRQVKEDLSKTNDILRVTRNDYNQLQQQHNIRVTEIANIRSEYESRESQLRLQFAADLAELKEQNTHLLNEMESSHRQALATEAARASAVESTLASVRLEHASAISSLRDEISSLESALREARHSVSNTSSDYSMASTELERARARVQQLESLSSTLQVDLSAANTRIAVLEQSVQDSKELSSRNSALLAAAEAARAKSEEAVQMYKNGYSKASERLQETVSEIKKGNAQILALQEQCKAAISKGKAKSEALRISEQRAGELERQLLLLQREFEVMKGKLDSEIKARESADALAQGLRDQLSTARDAVAENQQVIAWLNKELTESSGSKNAIHSLSTSHLNPSTNLNLGASNGTLVNISGLGSPNASRASIPSVYSSNLLQSSPLANSSASLPNTSANSIGNTASPSGATKGNPYLTGTVPLAQALSQLNGTKPVSAYFSTQ